jgi:hypothetical protein
MRKVAHRHNRLAALLLALLVIPAVTACTPSPTPSTQQPSQSATTCPNSLTSGLSGGTGAGHSAHFLSDYVSAPVTGAADVPNATFTNIFLYPDPNIESWDQHLSALAKQPNSRVDPDATVASLNAVTRALTCSSYFDLLTQYNINPPTFAGSEATIQSCVDAAVHDAGTSGVISFATMRSFADCERNNNKSDVHSDQVNIFVSPDLMSAAYGQSFDMCSAQSSSNGYHEGVSQLPTDRIRCAHCEE